MSSLTDIITRKYSSFTGVDFSKEDTEYYRSPNSLNMWKNYQSNAIETRPGMTLLNAFNNQIFGLFFYKINNTIHTIIHVGTSLLEWTNYPTTPATTKTLHTGMNIDYTKFFVFNNILFIKDGLNYLEYNGDTCKNVEPTIPITSIGRNPDGSINSDDTDTVYQPVNVLTNLRKNGFIANGTSAAFYLDATNLDSKSTYLMSAVVNGTTLTEDIDFTTDRTKGIVTFNTIPSKPSDTGDSNVFITYSKTGNDYKNRILKCTLLAELDNRIFFSGNEDYPNAIFHSELNDPRYIRDTAYYEDGLDYAKVKAIIAGNNALWVIKEINQNTTSVYYHTPTLDSTDGKLYPSTNGSISIGCISTGLNFNDDIVFFSKRGLEAIGGTIGTEQTIKHRSSNVDSKMVNETNYSKMRTAEYNGYLFCLVNSHLYIADSRQRFKNNSGETEYEWYYWELPNSINFITEYNGELFLGNANGQLFKLLGTTDNNTNIISYWTTSKDDFGYMDYTKTTNKRGGVVNTEKLSNSSIVLSTIQDGTEVNKGTFNDSKGYFVFKIKNKKFKTLQIKLSSNQPFGILSIELQAFISGYLKK